MDHFADIPTHSAKRRKSCQILSPSQDTLSDTQQYVTNSAKFCPPLKTHTLRHPLIRHQSCQILPPSQDTLSDTQQFVINPVEICPVTQETCIIFHCFSWQTIGRGESGWCSDVTPTHGACCVAARFAQLLRKSS